MSLLHFSQRFVAPFRKILPLAVMLSAVTLPANSQPDPGLVDGLGRRTNGQKHSIRYILPDPAFEGPKSELHPLLPPSKLRAIEPVRIVREILLDGRLMLRGGRAVAFLGIVPEASSSLTVVREAWKMGSTELAGKAVRLVFEQETHNASGELAAYVFKPEGSIFSGGRLLNETFLEEGLARVDSDAALSPQYRRRFQVAEDRAKRLGLGIWGSAGPGVELRGEVPRGSTTPSREIWSTTPSRAVGSRGVGLNTENS